MASQARKELELKMVVTADANRATAAMQQLAREADRAGLAVKSLSAGGGGGSPGMPAGPGGGGGLMAGAGRLAGGLAIVAGGVQTVAELQKAWVNLDNSMLSTRDKIAGFAAAIPLIGGALKQLVDNTIDMADRLNNPEQARRVGELRMRQPIEMSQMQTLSDARMKEFGLRGEVSAAGFSRRALEAFPTVASGQALLTRSVGGVAGSFLSASLGGMDPRLQGGLEAVQAAKQQANAAVMAEMEAAREARGGRLVAGGAMRDWRRAKSDLEAARDAAMGADHEAEGAAAARGMLRARVGGVLGDRVGDWVANSRMSTFGYMAGGAGAALATQFTGRSDPGSRINLQEKVLTEQRQLAAAQQALAEAEQKVANHKEKQLATARAIHELSKAQTDLMKSQVSILDEQIAKARGGAREFGAMDSLSQAGLLQIARKFKEGGREAVNADEFGILTGSGLTRDLVGQRAEQDASDSPMFKELQRVLGLSDAGELQKTRDKMKAEVDMKIQLDKEQFARTMEETLKTMNLKQLLGEIVAGQVELNLRKPEMGAAGAMAGLQ